jgi:amino acid adenylation domain-containing protein
LLDICWDGSIEDRFAAQVAQRLNAIAVVDGMRSISYLELWRQATALARRLAGLGVTRETPVGVLASRSADTIAAMVGIILAGGAYVPVNPRWPAPRIAHVVRASGLRLVIGPGSCGQDLANLPLADIRLVSIPAAETDGADDPARFTSPPMPAGRSPLAYVMYTSGSTGHPKGVMVEHRGVLRLVCGTDYFDFGPHQRFLHSAPVEFDAATFEIWGALLNGGTVHVADADTAVVARRFGAALRAGGITAAWLTAPVFHQFVDEDPGVFAPLACLLTGGDVVSARHVSRAREHNPGLAILNCYGPTENTTFTTVYRADGPLDGPVPLGRPIAGTTVAVCDDRGRRLPDGTTGELFIGGAGLARGYLGEPALTERKFPAVDGERRYRTGDLCRVEASGLLSFHGRVDDQVKIRGNLVEPAEVTAALLAIPGVRQAWTGTAGEPAGRRSLVAYVSGDVSGESVRAELVSRLPEYLCPERIVCLEHLPLTPSGKVNWRSLPEPPAAPAAGPADLSDFQRRLAGVWARVLGIPQSSIGALSGFRELGGDSLLEGRLAGEIGRELGRWPTLAAISSAGTLMAMAKAAASASQSPPDWPDRRAGSPAALHPQQRRLYAIWQARPQSLAYNVPVRITVRGQLDRPRFQQAVAATLGAHDALRMGFAFGAAGVTQQPDPDAVPCVEWHPGPAGEVLPGFVRPFPPDRPVVARALLTAAGPGHHELYLDVHHIVFDGESLRLVLREITERYFGTEPPAGPIGYADAARWSHEQWAGQDHSGLEAEWRAVLDGWQPLELPTDRPRGTAQPSRAARVTRAAGAALRARLAKLASERDTTVYALLLAAYLTVLSRLSGQRDIVVGSPASGRRHPALDGIVGMFVSTVPVRARWSDGCTYAELIRIADAASRRALALQEVPYEQLVSWAPDRQGGPDLISAFLGVHEAVAVHRADGWRAQADVLSTGALRFELDLQGYLHADRLVLDLDYATELYDRSSAEFLLDEYLRVAEEMTASPGGLACPAGRGGGAPHCPDFEF